MDALSVTQLNRFIKHTLQVESLLQYCLVRGTITDLKRHSSGHYYFSLKDDQCTIPVSLFGGARKPYAKALENGLLVTLEGSVSYYEPWGRLSLVCENVMIDQKSPIQIAFEKLKAELTALGYFDDQHKQPIPMLNHCIGIVTSSSGAVLHDILQVAKQRNPLVRFKLFSVPVQGPEAGPIIAQGIRTADADPDVDLIIVGRGGGSMEDLWCFNDRAIVEALYHCQKPTISAVGHETDFTLCDFAADQRSSTPSHAAELAVFPIHILTEQLVSKERYLHQQMRQKLALEQQRLQLLFSTKILHGTYQCLQGEKERLQRHQQVIHNHARTWFALQEGQFRTWRQQMTNQMQMGLQRYQQKLALVSQKLTLLNPLQVLEKGYSKLEVDGRAIRSTTELETGSTVSITMVDGLARATIKEVTHGSHFKDL